MNPYPKQNSLWLIFIILVIGTLVITSFLLLKKYTKRDSQNHTSNRQSRSFAKTENIINTHTRTARIDDGIIEDYSIKQTIKEPVRYIK